MALTVTEEAARLLEERLLVLDHEPDQLLRLIVKPDGLGLTLDVKEDEDQIVEHEGKPVLLVDPTLGEKLDGYTLGTAQGPEGEDFTLT